MTPPENIRLSDKARTQLITIKRRTGITSWNVPCRWALALSLSQPSIPPHENIPADSSLEMTWKTFGGGYDSLYWAALIKRAERDGVPMVKADLHSYFRLHLHRGISYLAGASGPANLKEMATLPLKK